MIITIIHGQSHQGSSYHIGKDMVENLPSMGVHEFFLPKDMPKFCNGCCLCMNKSQAACPHNEYMNPIVDAILRSDVLIFTTPTYCMRTSGSMKAFLDHCFVWWIIHRPLEANFHKKAVIISTAAGAGMKHSSSDIKASLKGWGISDIQTLNTRTLAPNWNELSDSIKKKITNKSRKITLNILNKKRKVNIKVKFTFYMMRSIHRKGMGASEEDTLYWKGKGWLKKERPWR